MKKSSKTDWTKIDAMSDDDIDYSDSPELTEEFFKIAFIRKPTHKKPVSLRLDEDIVEFFKKRRTAFASGLFIIAATTIIFIKKYTF